MDYERAITLLLATASDGELAAQLNELIANQARELLEQEGLETTVALSTIAMTEPLSRSLIDESLSGADLLRRSLRAVHRAYSNGILIGMSIGKLAGDR